MKISHKDDVVQESFANGEYQRFYVLLDGKNVNQAVSADEEAGVVVANRLNENGFVIKNDTCDDILRDELHGTVKILDIKNISSWNDGEFMEISKQKLTMWAQMAIDAEMPNRGL